MNQLETITVRSQPILSAQRISADGPGTILRDLETLIDFIGERGLPTQSKHGNLPAAVLPEINARLAAPIGVPLKRALLQHFPNIAGLFVLLRVMDFARTDRKRLWIDAAALAAWREFNPAEKYFALLEAWLFGADHMEILGGEPRSWSNQFSDNLEFLLKLKTDRWTAFHEYCHTTSSGGAVSTWNTHLQIMFGLITVSERALADRRSENRGWMLEKARRTPWGEAVAAVVARAVIAADGGNEMSLYRSPENAGFGFLQAAFGAYHPEWRRVFAVPRIAFQAGCHVFKAVMTDGRAHGAVWRRLAVPATETLDALAFAVLAAFGFDDDEHLYEFRYVDRFGRGIVYFHPYTDEGPYASEIALGDTGLPELGVMKFRFDFGAYWRFELRLERIDPPGGNTTDINVLEQAGDPPPQYEND